MTTLQTMLTLLRQRTNMEKSQYVTDLELTSYLNNSLAILDGWLVSKFSDYKISSAIVSISNSALQLPSDFLKLRGVDVVMDINSPDGYETLQPYQFKQRNQRRRMGNTLNLPQNLQYHLEGGLVRIQPTQLAGQYQYRLWYTPDYIPLVNTSDSLQAYMDSQAWYEYAIADSAVKVLAKQNMDPSTFMAQAAELKDHILKLSAPNRNAGEPIAVIDSRGYDAGGGYGWNW